MENTCTENGNWHVFEGGLPKEGDVCKCGKKVATSNITVLKDV